MKLTISLFITEIISLCAAIVLLISCHTNTQNIQNNPPAVAPTLPVEDALPTENFPDVIESMPNIMVYASDEIESSIDELENIVALEVSEKAKEYGFSK